MSVITGEEKGARDSNHMRTICPGVQFLESPILQFVTEKRFARGKH